MLGVTIIGHGVDTLVLNVCYADTCGNPFKQELEANPQDEFSRLQDEARSAEVAVVAPWVFKGYHLYMQPKRSRGQWKWILTCPALSLAVSQGFLSPIIAQVRLASEYLWSCETLWNAVVETLCLLYNVFGESIWVQVSEVDLCADLVGWDVSRCNWQ